MIVRPLWVLEWNVLCDEQGYLDGYEQLVVLLVVEHVLDVARSV